MRQSIIISVFSFILACCITIAYWLLRFGFPDNSILIPIRVLGASCFILFLPLGFSYFNRLLSDGVKSIFLNDTIVPVYGLILFTILGVLSSLTSINLSIVLIIMGYIFMLIGIFLFTSQNRLLSKVIITGFAFFFAVWIGGVVWHILLKPFIIEGWACGTEKIDTLFHISMAQMIKTYGIPSTGLDGVPMMKYHWGSHWIFAQLSNALNVPVVTIYQLGFPVIIAPLLFRSVLSFILLVKKTLLPEPEGEKINFVFWMIFLAIFIGLFKSYASGNEWAAFSSGGTSQTLFMLLSESYTVSIVLMFVLLASSVNFWLSRNTITLSQQIGFLLIGLPCMMFAIGFVKISTLYVMCCLLGYFFIRLKLYKKAVYVVSMGVIMLGSLLLFKFVFDPTEDHGDWEWLFFYRNFQIHIPTFILVFYIWTFIFIIVFILIKKLFSRSLQKDFFKHSLIPLESIVVICIAGFIPTLFLKIQNYDSLYFTEIQMWISSALVLAYVPFYINADRQIHFGKKIIITLSAVYFFYIYTINTKFFFHTTLGDSINHHKCILAKTGQPADSLSISQVIRASTKLSPEKYTKDKGLNFILKLKQLDCLPREEKKNSLIYVDLRSLLKNPDYHWGSFCHNMPFIVPSLSGIAMIDGIDITYFDCVGGSCCERLGLGYQYYHKWKTQDQINKPYNLEDLCERSLKQGFENLIIYDLQTENFRKYNCKRKKSL